MKNTIKLALLGAVITGVFSACSSEPKTVQYYEDPKNATELEAKIKECANASSYSKSFN
ncbi:EexN family lipoprotein, partial [Campylobacter jejuni]